MESAMKLTDTIRARGHENVQSTNKTTLEITKEHFLTKRGDCIIVVDANKGAADLSPEFKKALRNERARITVTIEADDVCETVRAWGNAQLALTHPHDLVVRKSTYLCSRTLGIRADKAAKDLSRKLVQRLCNPSQDVKITLTVEAAT